MSSRAVVDLPQPDSPTTPSVSPFTTSKSTPSTARTTASATAEHGLADGEVLHEPAHREQRLGGTAAVARDEGGNGAQFFTSMAERSPSENKLKEIEVMKMTRPGRAAIQGCT